MCGIFAYLGEKNTAAKIVFDGIKSLEYRGYDSWGIVLKQTNDKIFFKKVVGKIGNFQCPSVKATIGLGHTRWATHGRINQENSHPHTDCQQQIFIVHNGIVENYDQLKSELKRKNHKFTSETDSEVIAHQIEELIKKYGSLSKAVKSVKKIIKGMNAVIIFSPTEEKLYAFKNGSPLVFGQNNHNFFIASDAIALSPYLNNVYFLEDDELLIITKGGYLLQSNTVMNKKISWTKLEYDYSTVMLGHYPHYMIKEIEEQPTILSQLLKKALSTISIVSKLLQTKNKIYFLGCGTAYHAGIAGQYFLANIAQKSSQAIMASEFSLIQNFIDNQTLIIALSQSGETIDTLSAIKSAQKKGAEVLTITNVLGSTLYRLTHYHFLLNAGPEKAVASTKAYTSKIATLLLLTGFLSKKKFEVISQLQSAIKAVKFVLLQKNRIKKLANQLKKENHIFILGRHLSYLAALESALKIKEVSYIHAEGFAAGELKHGVIALISKNTPVIVYHPPDQTYENTLTAIYEVKARGARVIGVSAVQHSSYDDFIPVPYCREATIIPNVVAAQLLSYYLSVTCGYDPDRPRNLAKSVTVK